MLKALLIVFKQAVQRMTAAGGGKDEESFTNDANGALCYERPDGHAALAALPALLTKNAVASLFSVVFVLLVCLLQLKK